jgi:hypothetical protein
MATITNKKKLQIAIKEITIIIMLLSLLLMLLLLSIITR